MLHSTRYTRREDSTVPVAMVSMATARYTLHEERRQHSTRGDGLLLGRGGGVEIDVGFVLLLKDGLRVDGDGFVQGGDLVVDQNATPVETEA